MIDYGPILRGERSFPFMGASREYCLGYTKALIKEIEEALEDVPEIDSSAAEEDMFAQIKEAQAEFQTNMRPLRPALVAFASMVKMVDRPVGVEMLDVFSQDDTAVRVIGYLRQHTDIDRFVEKLAT